MLAPRDERLAALFQKYGLNDGPMWQLYIEITKLMDHELSQPVTHTSYQEITGESPFIIPKGAVRREFDKP